MELKRIRRVKLPAGEEGRLGSLFLSLLDDKIGSYRHLVPVTVSRHCASKQIKIHMEKRQNHWTKVRNQWQESATSAHDIVKVELRKTETPLETIMTEIAKFIEPGKLIAAQLDLDGYRERWLSPSLENEEFKKLVQAREIRNNGSNDKQKAFFGKLEKLYALTLGWWQDPERLFQEIEYFKKGFSPWG